MTVSYPDVSNYNGPMPLQAGTVACFAKSSEGTGFRDAQYAHFKAEAARVGALFGAYHFLLQGNGAGQARWAFSIVGRGVPMMIDFEPEYDAAGNPTSLPSIADAVAFRDAYRALGGLCTVNYLPHWYWSGHLGSPSLAPLKDLALVASGYTAYSDTAAQWAPYGGVAPAIWQWTDAQPYSGQKVDFNAFRGTVDELRSLLGLAAAAPVSPSVLGGPVYLISVHPDPTLPPGPANTGSGIFAVHEGLGPVHVDGATYTPAFITAHGPVSAVSPAYYEALVAAAAASSSVASVDAAAADLIGAAIVARLPSSIELSGTLK